MDKRIYVFTNIMHNCCHGEFYFIAVDEHQARMFAREFEKDHNIKCDHNTNYNIVFDMNNVKSFATNYGFLPLNRFYVE